jgi:thioredoxin-related protein
MKKAMYAVCVAVMLLVSPVLASDYDSALKTAKKDSKPVLLYFFNKSCGYCTMMDKDTLADKDVSAVLKKDFVFLRVDTDRWADLAMLYEVRGTPSSWFLDPSGKPIRQIPGYIPKKEYKTVLEFIRGRHYKEMDIQAYFNMKASKS